MTKIENVKCPDCDGPMVSRSSQYGVFWGCKNYPHCKGTRDNEGRSKTDREIEKQLKDPNYDSDDLDACIDKEDKISEFKTTFNKEK